MKSLLFSHATLEIIPMLIKSACCGNIFTYHQNVYQSNLSFSELRHIRFQHHPLHWVPLRSNCERILIFATFYKVTRPKI